MADSSAIPQTSVLERLRQDRPLVAMELRPPRSGLDLSGSVGAWIDMYHSIQRVTRRDTLIFLTDNAVGQSEEENLSHLANNLASDVPLSRIVPFLTCKHALEYCRMYASRAASCGFEALTVLGGDKSVGAERCLPHAYQLRYAIRQRVPSLNLGGWANPHRDPVQQVEYLARQDFEAEFYLAQVVSHHSLGAVESFLNELERRGVDMPGVFGVFYYRSANARTLERLAPFFPVPADALTREFDAGASADEICLRTIRALRELGINKVYLSNLSVRRLDAQYQRLVRALD